MKRQEDGNYDKAKRRQALAFLLLMHYDNMSIMWKVLYES